MAQLTVEAPPMKYVFLNPLLNTQEMYRTKQGVLSCKVNSAHAPLVWYRGEEPIDTKDSRYIIEKDAVGRFTLTIKTVEQVDQAEWMAKINNDVYSKVIVFVKEPLDTFVIPLKSQRASERESATFECDVKDKDIAVEWWHDGVKIVPDKRRKEERFGCKRRLIISQVKLEDHGEYKCTTKDDGTMAQLIVEALNKFIVKLEDQEVFEKDDVNLCCETKDTKTPGLWFRRGKPISSMSGGKYETQSRAGVHSIKISKIEMSESDVYEIHVGSLRGECTVTVLKAERKPQISWIECEAGKPRKIEVPFQVEGTRRGDPKPILLRNGKPVDLDKMKDLVEVVINGDVAQIIFKNPQKTDTGKWALELQNTDGSSGQEPFELVVKDRSKLPMTHGNFYIDDVLAEVFSYLSRACLQVQLRNVNRQFNRILSSLLNSAPRHILDSIQMTCYMNGINTVSIRLPTNPAQPVLCFPRELPNFVFARSGTLTISPNFNPREDYNGIDFHSGIFWLRFYFQGEFHEIMRKTWTRSLTISFGQIERSVAFHTLSTTLVRSTTSLTVADSTDLSLITEWASSDETKHVKIECITLESAKKCLTSLTQSGDAINLHARLSINKEEIDDFRKWAKEIHGLESDESFEFFFSETFDVFRLPEGVQCSPPCF